jgi:DNA-binding NarL/FixJ family response regulator
VVTTYVGDAQVLRALKAGARASLLKNGLHKERLETIRAVHAGKKALSAEVSTSLPSMPPMRVDSSRSSCAAANCRRDANKEIAVQLSISEETVKGQVRNVLSKTPEPT